MEAFQIRFGQTMGQRAIAIGQGRCHIVVGFTRNTGLRTSMLAGSRGICPAMNNRPFHTAAWLYGPMLAGAHSEWLCTCRTLRDHPEASGCPPKGSRMLAAVGVRAGGAATRASMAQRTPGGRGAATQARAGADAWGTMPRYAALAAGKCGMWRRRRCTYSTACQPQPRAANPAGTPTFGRPARSHGTVRNIWVWFLDGSPAAAARRPHTDTHAAASLRHGNPVAAYVGTPGRGCLLCGVGSAGRLAGRNCVC